MLGEQRVGRIEDLVTLDNDTTIQEALDYGYVVGKKESIKQLVSGVLKAMVDGIKKDGDGRKIDNFLSINAYARAYLKDVTDDFNRLNGKIALRARMLKELPQRFPNLAFSSSMPFNIEVNAPTATKGHALLALCGLLEIDPRDSLALGDGTNDLDMIQNAGVGVSMANGDPSVRAAADYVTESCDDGGFANAVRKFC
jgi:hydroxymethylpyrimidine pyrophosphatase-like HAD family hydrolase